MGGGDTREEHERLDLRYHFSTTADLHAKTFDIERLSRNPTSNPCHLRRHHPVDSIRDDAPFDA